MLRGRLVNLIKNVFIDQKLDSVRERSLEMSFEEEKLDEADRQKITDGPRAIAASANADQPRYRSEAKKTLEKKLEAPITKPPQAREKETAPTKKAAATPRFNLETSELVAQGTRFGHVASEDYWRSALRFLHKNDLLTKCEQAVKKSGEVR